jgi:hypothetical protein
MPACVRANANLPWRAMRRVCDQRGLCGSHEADLQPDDEHLLVVHI